MTKLPMFSLKAGAVRCLGSAVPLRIGPEDKGRRYPSTGLPEFRLIVAYGHYEPVGEVRRVHDD